jgi:hypothetical protein
VKTRLSQILILLACLLLVGCQTTTVRQATPTPTAAPLLPVTPAAKPTSPGAPPTNAAPPPVPPPPTPPAQAPGAQPTTPSSPVTAARPTVAPAPPTAAPPAPTVAPPAVAPAACTYGQTKKLAQVEDKVLKEASALAASSRFPGVYWTLNDSGNSPTIYALDESGKSRGTFKVEDADNEDWEAIQVGPGKDGSSALYIGDIGDNDEKRKEIQIYRVPEPEPGPAGGKAPNGKTTDAETFRFTYPDGAHDAESLLVHPITGEILIVTKEVPGRATVYRAPMPLTPGRSTKLEQVTKLDIAKWGMKTDVIDDATVTADARRVSIRSYGGALEFDVPPGAALASIWNQTPRLIKIQDPPQGEGISYRLDGTALLTIGEDSPTFLWIMPRQC